MAETSTIFDDPSAADNGAFADDSSSGDAAFMLPLGYQVALAILPKFSSLLSMMGSSLIAYQIVWSQRRERLRKPFHRLVLGMCTCDIMASTAWFFTTWPVPSRHAAYSWGASGNTQTCTAQGFFAQFSIATVMYNASLATYYTIVTGVVRVKQQQAVTTIHRLEPLLHVNALCWGLGTAVASIVLQLFNTTGWDCWIAAEPVGCVESWRAPPGESGTCARGDNATLYIWVFYYAPLWVIIIYASLTMFFINRRIRRTEKLSLMEDHMLGTGLRRVSMLGMPSPPPPLPPATANSSDHARPGNPDGEGSNLGPGDGSSYTINNDLTTDDNDVYDEEKQEVDADADDGNADGDVDQTNKPPPDSAFVLSGEHQLDAALGKAEDDAVGEADKTDDNNAQTSPEGGHDDDDANSFDAAALAMFGDDDEDEKPDETPFKQGTTTEEEQQNTNTINNKGGHTKTLSVPQSSLNDNNAAATAAGSVGAVVSAVSSTPQSPTRAKRKKHSRAVAIQSFFYLGVFYITWFWPSVFQIYMSVTASLGNQNPTVVNALNLLSAMTVPIQGFLNLIVYQRPAYLRYRKSHPNMSKIKLWFITLGHELGYWSKSTKVDIDIAAAATAAQMTNMSIGGIRGGGMRKDDFYNLRGGIPPTDQDDVSTSADQSK